MHYKPKHKQISSLYGITTIKRTIGNVETVIIVKNGAVRSFGYSLLGDTVHIAPTVKAEPEHVIAK